MEPIINPWWIYFAEKSEDISFLLGLFCMPVLLIAIMWIILQRSGDLKTSCPKIFLVIGIVGTIISGLLPSRETIYTMMTMEQITPNNIKIVGDTAQDIVDYVINGVDSIINKGEKNENKN